MRYKHYSFDLWLTLIKSNPQFKVERAKYLHGHFNPTKMPLEVVSIIIKEVDEMCNRINEIYGGSINALEMYLMVLHRLEFPIHTMSKMDVIAVYHYIEGIFLKYPPVFFSEDTLPTLLKLREKHCTMSILSNTGFIMGSTIDKVLDKHLVLPTGESLRNLFLFILYSDELGVSKPNKMAFDFAKKLYTQRTGTVIPVGQMIHIGDNHKADGRGAKEAGLSSQMINAENEPFTIKDLLIL